MKYYDFEKAKNYIEQHKASIHSASLGFHEDWFWTAETIFEDGEFVKDLSNPELKIGGINGSYWATPTLDVNYFDGFQEQIECSKGDEPSQEELAKGQGNIALGLGCLSGPVQESRGGINRKI